MTGKKGLVYVFFGNGKGKTSAALGVTVRSLLIGKKVAWISWYKEENWKTSEMRLPKKFWETLEMYWMGKGFYGSPRDHSSLTEHREAAREALLLAKNKMKESGVSLVVMDEVLKAVEDGLLKSAEVLETLRGRGTVHVILTGHACPMEIVEEADLVTEMKKIKHPYDKGVLAVRGLDF